MLPIRYDLFVKRGEDFRQVIQIDGVDLTEAEAASQVRPTPGSEELTQDITCTVDAEAGTVTMSLTAEETEVIPAGKYEYDIYLIIAGQKTFPIEGRFTVLESVTR